MRKQKQTYNPCDDCQYAYSKNGQESRVCKICEFEELRTADVVLRSEGEWLPDMEWFDEEEGISKKAGFYQTGWKCSLCGRNEHKKEPYCNCGARMKGGE